MQRRLPAGMRSHVRAALLLTLTALVTVAVIRHFTSLEGIFEVWRGLRPFPLITAIGFLAISVLLGVARWRVVLSALGIYIPYGRCVSVVLGTWPLSLVSPSRVGDFARGLAIRRDAPLIPALSSVLLEKMVDIPVLMLLAAGGALGVDRPKSALALLACAVAASALVLALSRIDLQRVPLPDGIRKRLAPAQESLVLFLGQGSKLSATAVLSLGGWLLNVFMLVALLGAVGLRPDVGAVLAGWPLAIFVGLIPVTLAGAGTRDAAFVYLLGAPTQANAQVLSATMLYTALGYGLVALVGLPFLVTLIRMDPLFGNPPHNIDEFALNSTSANRDSSNMRYQPTPLA